MTKPIRMCVVCRQRAPKDILLRFQLRENQIVFYSGEGRSMYLCLDCAKNQKKIKSLSKRLNIEETSLVKFLKEPINNG
ncbi:MAG: DUF448 domain-containing protein [Campylobacterales bacterium]|nr:DUF448 domain-containing protein [Campylobacterales bacterium]